MSTQEASLQRSKDLKERVTPLVKVLQMKFVKEPQYVVNFLYNFTMYSSSDVDKSYIGSEVEYTSLTDGHAGYGLHITFPIELQDEITTIYSYNTVSIGLFLKNFLKLEEACGVAKWSDIDAAEIEIRQKFEIRED